MTINWISGCTNDNLIINGRNYSDYNDKDKIILRQLILNWLVQKEDIISTKDIIRFILEMAGKYECSDEPCECCGDFIESYEIIL